MLLALFKKKTKNKQKQKKSKSLKFDSPFSSDVRYHNKNANIEAVEMFEQTPEFKLQNAMQLYD